MGWFTLVFAIILFSTQSCLIVSSGAGLGKTAIPAGSVRSIREMAVSRAAHTATLLGDGRVLIVGGFGNGEKAMAQTELFVPSRSAFEPAGRLIVQRASHTATMLPDGRVLIAGGYNGAYLDSSEIFDPRTGRFTPGGRMSTARSEHTATRLSDGRILIAGGVGIGWTFLADAEIYDPRTSRFTATGKMTMPRESHTATALKNGKVLITGGHKDRRSAMTVYASTEIYDPARGAFEAAADLTIKRHKHDAVLLRDGRVLIAGGSDERDSRGSHTSLEIFDPETGRFSRAGEMTTPRYKLNGATILMSNGNVLLAGGANRAEVFDPARSAVRTVDGTFGSQRLFATATLLPGDRVLITGGYDEATRVASGAWIFEPSEKGIRER